MLQSPGASLSLVPDLFSSMRSQHHGLAHDRGRGPDTGFLTVFDTSMRESQRSADRADVRSSAVGMTDRKPAEYEESSRINRETDYTRQQSVRTEQHRSDDVSKTSAEGRETNRASETVDADRSDKRTAESQEQEQASVETENNGRKDLLTTPQDERQTGLAENKDESSVEERVAKSKEAGKARSKGDIAGDSEQLVAAAVGAGENAADDSGTKAHARSLGEAGDDAAEKSKNGNRRPSVNATRAADGAASSNDRRSQTAVSVRSADDVSSAVTNKRSAAGPRKDKASAGSDKPVRETASAERRVRVEVRDLRQPADRVGQGDQKAATFESEGGTVSRRLEPGDTVNRPGFQDRGDQSLTRTVREQTQPEILRHARLVVRGEASGDIRLVLKPEHLGRVRISLHMEDNRIAGRIIVENASVRDAFQSNVQALERALRESGIETAGLEVSVGEGGDHNQGDDRDPGFRRRVASDFDELVPRLVGWYDDTGTVNVYV